MGRPVIVVGVDGDEGKLLLITVCLNPDEAYASKNGKHVGFLKEGVLVPDNKDVPVSVVETFSIETAYIYASDALKLIHSLSEG